MVFQGQMVWVCQLQDYRGVVIQVLGLWLLEFKGCDYSRSVGGGMSLEDVG